MNKINIETLMENIWDHVTRSLNKLNTIYRESGNSPRFTYCFFRSYFSDGFSGISPGRNRGHSMPLMQPRQGRAEAER